jgi:choline dehydrogenase-like flavoprotein
MIVEAKDYDQGTILEADICIIGGGPAAISFALSFLDRNLKILILAGGLWTETPENRELNRGLSDPENSHEPLEYNRVRAFGGGTAVWGGRCLPLDPIDFEKREWIPHSGWPISYETVASYYQQSLDLCEAGQNIFDAKEAFPDKNQEIIPGLDNEYISSSRLERWSPPTRFALRYRDILESSPNIHVYLDAHVTGLNVETSADKIDSLTVSIRSSVLRIVAPKFILAAGGIENARLLLASKSAFHPNGIGNKYDNVGRYYMSHLTGTYGAVDPSDRKEILFLFETDEQGVFCRRRWWPTPKMQQECKVGNAIMYLNRSINAKENPVESFKFVTNTVSNALKNKTPKNIIRALNKSKNDLREHSVYSLKNIHNVIPAAIGAGFRRVANKRVPLRLPSINSKWLHIYFQTEHMPNPESRIVLSETLDRLGVPVPIVKVAFSESDIETVIASLAIFFERFEEQKKGKIYFDRENLREFLMSKIANFDSVAHHLGTTRMSDDPATGVVDANCKVHDVSNLYIAGSSIFPTGGHANPTLTIVALTLRLADHLKELTDQAKEM